MQPSPEYGNVACPLFFNSAHIRALSLKGALEEPCRQRHKADPGDIMWNPLPTATCQHNPIHLIAVNWGQFLNQTIVIENSSLCAY